MSYDKNSPSRQNNCKDQLTSQHGDGLIKKLIAGTLLAVIGAAIAFGLGKPVLDNARASTKWPTVKGTVLESDVEKHRSRSGRPGHRHSKITYQTHVVYKYTIDGKQLKADQIWFGSYSSSNQSAAQRIAAQYPVHSQVDVHYKPHDPSVAVLQPGAFFDDGFGI